MRTALGDVTDEGPDVGVFRAAESSRALVPVDLRAGRRIEDYAMIGDLHTAALVGRDGSIDWCCLPRFDSDACFAALLGNEGHGRWLLAPTSRINRVVRRYRPETLILESTIETASGSVRVIDFMPLRRESPNIVRIVEGLTGHVALRTELAIRPDFGRIKPWLRQVDGVDLAVAGPDALCLRTPAKTTREGATITAEFDVRQGERIPFVLTWYPSHLPPPQVLHAEEALGSTEEFWREWAGQCSHHGLYRDEVVRSLIVLKALTYHPTGAVVAAPTTSLPEQIGGVRNWDYRFCWLRDATQTVLAMIDSGYQDEATTWRQWLLRAIAGDAADVQIMYGLGGERRLDERELEWLPGFEGSAPVRVGNAASTQLQLDVYGEVLDALYATRLEGAPADDAAWTLIGALIEWLETNWRREDAGIWEVRGPNRHFTHSKVLAWVAFDRAVRFCEEFGRDGPVERWRAVRDEIHAEVLERGFSLRKQAFTQSFDSEELDASLLQIPLVGFLPATDPRVISTVKAIRAELMSDGLLLRYRTHPAGLVDGLPRGEGVFLACSFWLVAVLALQGEIAEAYELFERLLGLRNDVCLLSEEYDPAEKRMLGNFPQALTHLALVDAALILDRQTDRPRNGEPERHGGARQAEARR